MKLLLFIVPLIFVISCNDNRNEDKIDSDSLDLHSENSQEGRDEISSDGKSLSHMEIMSLLKPQNQIFKWTPSNDTVLTCDQGTKIYLPKECLEEDTYNPNRPVIIEVAEYYSLSDFISDKLTTISHNGLLETGGMINIRIYQDQKDLILKKGKDYAILFPKQKKDNKSMSTFYGERDADSSIIWKKSDVRNAVSEKPISQKQIASCRFKLTSRTSAIGDEEVEWLLKGSNEYAPDYIEQNMQPSQKMIDDFCDLSLNPSFQIQYDKVGNVKDIKIVQNSIKVYDSVIVDFIRSMPKVDMTTMPECCPNFYYHINFEGWENSSFDRVTYKKKFEEKYSNIQDDVIETVEKAELNYYILSASKFGWINCDRFWKVEDEKIDFVVDSKGLDDINLSLVFSDIKSIMPATKVNNSYVFKDVPIGKEVKLIGVGYEGQDASLAVSRTSIKNQIFTLSGFKKFKLTELEKELNSL